MWFAVEDFLQVRLAGLLHFNVIIDCQRCFAIDP